MLTIVIPALNEEQSIQSICHRCLDQATAIREATGHGIEVIVVSDGSTDRTASLAQAIEGVRTIVFDKNRGYGAAILEGFRQGEGELVGFLDADGTCDPAFFIPMIQAVEAGASVALGNRLGMTSEMPAIRRLGNRFFAGLIRLLSGAQVLDSASGMRVLRRDQLEILLPLPDGLHFTPAMSCRAALDPRLQLAEVPMTYAEREGRSKLGVVRDGLRFLRVILETAVTYRPLLIFGFVGGLMLLVAGVYAIGPFRTWFATGTLPDDSVYRVLTILVLGTGGLVMIYAGALAESVSQLVNPARPASRPGRLVRKLFFSHPFLLALACFVIALASNARALLQYLEKGEIDASWATIAFGAFFALAAIQLLAFGLLQRVGHLLELRADQKDL